MTEFKGKLLIRRATTPEGKQVLVIAGVVEPTTPIEEFDGRDEMWAAHLLVMDSIKFVNEKNQHFSPEDFLENANDVQNKDKWSRKDG
jgi:hypothetical protein